MMIKTTSILFSVVLMVACNNLSTPPTAATPAPANALVQSFGAKVTDADGVQIDQATAAMKDGDSLAMKIVGKVTEVCQAKGCWMNVVAENGQGLPVFVKFKDYAFFMPKDCSGKKVLMDGVLFKEITPVDELRHYAEDKGATKEEIAAIVLPKEELKFMANGVLLYEK